MAKWMIGSTLTAWTRRHSSDITVSRVVIGMKAALLTKMSQRPNRSSTAATQASTAAGSPTSQVRDSFSPPPGSPGRTAAASSLSTSTRLAPSAARRWQKACPMPRRAPVTTAVLFWSDMGPSPSKLVVSSGVQPR